MACCQIVFDRKAALEYHITKAHVTIPSRCLVCLMARATSGEIVCDDNNLNNKQSRSYSKIKKLGTQ